MVMLDNGQCIPISYAAMSYLNKDEGYQKYINYDKGIKSLLTFRQGSTSPLTMKKYTISEKMEMFFINGAYEYTCVFFELICVTKSIAIYVQIYLSLYFLSYN